MPTLTAGRRIASDSEAIFVARKLSRRFAVSASERDRDRRLPEAELDELSASGLLAITVPRAFGGPEVAIGTVAEVVRLLAIADGSIAQIPHSHFVFLDALARQGTPELQADLFGRILNGERLANAQSERGGKTITDDSTTLSPGANGALVLNGTKYYSTGALYADLLAVRAVRDARKAIAYIDKSADGVTVTDDWDGLGQRTTASGTVELDNVEVQPDRVIDFTGIFERPTTFGARAQILHTAIDAGIARGALDAGVTAAHKARPWFEAGVDRAVDDPLVIQQAGELDLQVRAAEALIVAAAHAISAAEADLTADSAAEASIATAAAKVAASRASVAVSAALFELGGTRAAAASLNLSRYFRDARTHTLHDPERWKVQHIGRWVLNHTLPPRHGQI